MVDTPAATAAYAFRCLNCNALVPAEHAGENRVPHACPVCRAGVTWSLDASGQPVMTLHPENWVVLADLPSAQLKEIIDYHGPIDIEAHVPFSTVVERGPDVTESVAHRGPDCDVCRVNRPGTTAHSEGKVDTVTNPTWVHSKAPLSAAPRDRAPQNFSRTANEAAGTQEQTS